MCTVITEINAHWTHRSWITRVLHPYIPSYINYDHYGQVLSITSQRKSSSITWTHAICLNPTGILTGKRPSSHVPHQGILQYIFLSCLANKITSGKPMSTLNILTSNPRVITKWLCKALLLNWHFCGKLVFLMQVWSTFTKDMNAYTTSKQPSFKLVEMSYQLVNHASYEFK